MCQNLLAEIGFRTAEIKMLIVSYDGSLFIYLFPGKYHGQTNL